MSVANPSSSTPPVSRRQTDVRKELTCLTQLTLGTYAVQPLPNHPLKFRGNETFVTHRAASACKALETSSNSEWGETCNVQRFRGGLVFKAHRLLYHSTLGLRVIKKKGRNLQCKCGRRVPRRTLGGVPREQKMLKGHLPRVIYQQGY